MALRQWITYNPNAISAIATNASDQSFNGAFTFENYNKGAEQTISYGATQISLQYSKSPFLGKQHLSIMELILPMETKMRQIHLF